MMRAVQVDEKRNIRLVSLPTPEIGPEDVLLRTIGCGVCGTDVLKINLSLVNKPTVLGHELVGTVAAVGSRQKDFSVGDRMVVAHHVPCFSCHYCRHGNVSMCAHFKKTNLDPGGFADYVRVSGEHVRHTAFKLPQDMPWEEALFTEPLACCVRNIDRLPLLAGDTVIVIGLGSIGLMMASLLKRLSCNVIGIDLDATRGENSRAYGVDVALTSTAEASLSPALDELTDKRGADGVIFTAGPSSLLNPSLKWIRNGGFVNLFSHLSGEVGPVDTSELYHRELQLLTTYSASPDSLKKAFAILRDEPLNLRRMIAPLYAPDSLSAAVSDINERRTLKAVLDFETSP